MPTLIVRSGVNPGRRYNLVGELISLGRHSSNVIHLEDDRLSRHHLELRATPGGYSLIDIGSGNGTLVNDRPVTQCDLKPGDAISVGDTVLVYDDEDARFRSSILRAVPEAAGRQIVANLGVLYEVAAMVSHILDVDELLGRILDLVMGTTGADHGGILLIDDGTSELMPRVVRSRADTSFNFSRTIIDYVQKERQGVLVSDAAADDRFASGESIVRHNLREVLCVPMRGRHDSVGVLVLDTLTSAGRVRFTGEHLDLAVAIAHQAALAVEETRYYRALMNAERLAAVGQTITGMSHHIKNVMQGVRFGGDMIRAGLRSDDRELIGKGWTLVEKNQGRIDKLIMEMLSYSKEREPIKSPTDVRLLINDVLALVKGTAVERSIEIEADIPADLPSVNCDGDAIHAAILNIVGNALDALESVDDARVSVLAKNQGATIVITFDDNGSGVPVEQREAVFQPFVSTKGNRGTGLGLPVSRKSIREHGGDLTIEDSPLGGARFMLCLPV